MPIIHWAETTAAYQKFQGRQGQFLCGCIQWDACREEQLRLLNDFLESTDS